eukprot:6162666-Prymnesium_polylepis.1
MGRIRMDGPYLGWVLNMSKRLDCMLGPKVANQPKGSELPIDARAPESHHLARAPPSRQRPIRTARTTLPPADTPSCRYPELPTPSR